MSLLTAVHFLLSCALFYAVFCRAAKMTKNTKVLVRLSVWLFGVCSCFGLALTFYPNWKPDAYTTFLLFCAVVAKFVFSSQWKNGVPKYFLKTETQNQ